MFNQGSYFNPYCVFSKFLVGVKNTKKAYLCYIIRLVYKWGYAEKARSESHLKTNSSKVIQCSYINDVNGPFLYHDSLTSEIL